MRNLLIVFGILSGVSAQAAELPVKITSFVRPDMNTSMAELCGTVVGSAEQIATARVRIAVDGARKGVGIYNTTADDAGDFCVTVTSYYGRVNVSATTR